MKKINFDLDLDLDSDSDQEIKSVSLDLETVKTNVPKFSSQKLCEMIICDRYFGLGKNISSICMEELSKRRIAGDKFDFESHIDSAGKELPPLVFDMPDLRTVLNQAVSLKNKK
jgi:hypothetical protein